MIALVTKYLKEANHFHKRKNFEDAFYSHPNYPSLLAVTDGLNQVEIENVAATVPFVHINELPDYFITQLEKESNEYFLVTKNGDNFVLENEKEIKKTISRQELEKIWSGIILIIEENEVKSTLYSIKKSPFIIALAFVLLSLIAIFNYDLNLLNAVFLFLSGIGFFVSVEILKTYFKENNNTESKFCSVNKNFSCNSIINSKNYPFSNYIEFIDLPIVFFSTAFFSQILGLNILFYFGVVSLLSFPLLAYSIYLQKFILKKWCLLCLIISLLMISIVILFLINFINNAYNNQDLVSLLLVTILFTSAWFLIKKVLIKAKSNLQKLNSLLRFKRNPDVFGKISLAIENEEEFDTLEKIKIGNTNAKNTITLFLSPSCPHCHTTFKNATAFIIKYSEQVKLEVCFNLNINNLDNPYLLVYKTVLHLYNTQNNDCIKALEDWHIRNFSLNEWKDKWFIDNEFTQENIQIIKHFEWCLTNDLNYAPVKIFNRKILPDEYDIDELFYFFKE
jgi:disulfide bond formation protein DsbB